MKTNLVFPLTDNLPEPLVPSDADLQSFPYMPIEITRLLGSEFHTRSTDAAWRAGVVLWLKAFHQKPAGSLPNDDMALAHLAEFGRDLRSWSKVRGQALRNWQLCRDGRLYHPYVAEKAIEAWLEKIMRKRLSVAGNLKQGRFEQNTADLVLQLEAAQECLKRLNPSAKGLKKRSGAKSEADPDNSPAGQPDGGDLGCPEATQLNQTDLYLNQEIKDHRPVAVSAREPIASHLELENRPTVYKGRWFEPSDETREELRVIAPGWDRQMLISKYNDFGRTRPRPNNPDRAFIGWVKAFTKGKLPS